MTQPRPIVTLLTDFGEQDDYVGAMKGVILSIAPDAHIVDISHQVAPQNILQAASILDNVYRYYPAHTVHVVVVDPGVGSARQPIALQTARGTFVAPDNGVLTPVRAKEQGWKAIILNKPDYWLPSPSNTFHGRDIFSPVAAHLASGVAFEKLGQTVSDIVALTMPSLTIAAKTIKGEVTRIDSFGNALTNIAPLRWVDDHTLEFTGGDVPVRIDARTTRVVCGWHTVDGIHQNYSQVVAGQALAVVGSSSELEIAVSQGNASEQFAIQASSPVTLRFD